MSKVFLRILCVILVIASVAAAALIPWIGMDGDWAQAVGSEDDTLNAVTLYEGIPSMLDATERWFEADEDEREWMDEYFEEFLGLPYIVYLITFWLCLLCVSVAALLSLLWVILALCGKRFAGWVVTILWILAFAFPFVMQMSSTYVLGGGLIITVGLSLIASALTVIANKKPVAQAAPAALPTQPEAPQAYQPPMQEVPQTYYQPPVP